MNAEQVSQVGCWLTLLGWVGIPVGLFIAFLIADAAGCVQ